MWAIDRQLDVVEVAALAGDEARVLAALDRLAEDVVGASSTWSSSSLPRYAERRRAAVAPSRIAAAAARMAATMFW